jgi:predicted ATPase
VPRVRGPDPLVARLPGSGSPGGNEALAFSEALSHPTSLASVELFASIIHQFRGEELEAHELAQRQAALAAEHGLTLQSGFATTICGWAIAKQGQIEEGIAQVREGLAAITMTGAAIGWPWFLSMLAEACMEGGRLEEALSALTEARAFVNEHEARYFEPEINRLIGELLLKQADSNAPGAQGCFRRAIEVARNQSAKSWELRATMSLARLLDKQGKRDEARAMLAEIYYWFTEGLRHCRPQRCQGAARRDERIDGSVCSGR